MRHGSDQPLAPTRPSVTPRHLGGSARLVNEHQPARVEHRLAVSPVGAGGGYVLAFLFGGVRRLFLKLIPCRLKNRHTVEALTLTRRRQDLSPLVERTIERLHGEVLPTGSVRTPLHGAVTMLPGFSEGNWWVQDAAAALPATLFGDIRDKSVADLCAAPGGKTAQLAQAGARVTAVDRSPARVRRLQENLVRLKLAAEIVVADAADWTHETFDAVLVDAPCTATGTIRRHPDIAWLKQEQDIAALKGLQDRLLQRAAGLLKPNGTLVYCTCSLEPEEGELAIERLLATESGLRRAPVEAAEVAGRDELITTAGDLRTLPSHFPHADPRLAGLDGFFAARLVKA